MTDLAKTSKTSPPGVDLPRIRALVEPIALSQGAEVVEVEWVTDGRGFVLRISVDKAGSAAKKAQTEASAVDLEVCSTISRAVSQALDADDPLPAAAHYSLEVGSPGVERALRGEADYVRFEGKKAKLRLVAPPEGSKERVLVGVLGGLSGVSNATLTFTCDAVAHAIPLSNIASGRLVFELGSAERSKPGKKTRK